MRVAVLCTGYYGQRSCSHYATQSCKVSIQRNFNNVMTVVNGCHSHRLMLFNKKPIMLSLHISCGRMNHASDVTVFLTPQQPYVIIVQSSCYQPEEISNVWTGILRNCMIRPYLLPERITGHLYLVFLRDGQTDFLDDIPLAAIHGLLLQHNEATVHFSSSICVWLDMKIPG